MTVYANLEVRSRLIRCTKAGVDSEAEVVRVSKACIQLGDEEEHMKDWITQEINPKFFRTYATRKD
ncbi:hypothetical protein [Moorena sp. SIO3I6]|uniref:hypothetical protein n=1 Tax=Moorena sp. SIO3I6 TaxID=2607831 RepID=UPI0013F76F9D|nr:hypothetical protein [Moorena sp. SIO3I6]NEP28794.1 hypothetical protein [Moorena sp. SIO3I6]